MSLVVENVSHRFEDAAVVSSASLRVAPGEVVSLFGHSGCGKTTLLRIIAGLEPLQKGAVSLDGENISSLRPEERPLGLVFQDFVLFPHLTVENNVAFALKSGKDQKRRVSEQLAALGLSGLERRYPHQLSGGQQQRVAIARALVRNPRALLLDEPFSNIDAAHRKQMREELRTLLKAQNVAVILVTHDPEEALTLGDRIALMRAGEIIENAAPIELHNAPETLEGASIFPGCQQVEGVARNGRLITGLGVFPAPDMPDGAGVAVLRSGALTASPDDDGDFIVIDRRFLGEGWVAVVENRDTGLRLNISDAQWLTTRQVVQLSVNESRIFVFPS